MGIIKKHDQNFHRYILLFSILIYLVTAYNSHGYYHADEHYQIIEASGLKLGTHTPTDVAWEINSQIRPTLQPTIAFVMLKGAHILSIKDPYHQAFILRLLTTFISLFAIYYFVNQTKYQFSNKKSRHIYYILSYLLWFVPVISVRFSSETWSGLFFLLALAAYHDNKTDKMKPLVIGALWGLSFLFRFQIAFAIMGFFLWLLIIKKYKFHYIATISIGFLIMLAIGTLIDSWFYGTFVFTPWNYFEKTILKDWGSGFGISPWYFYLEKIITYPGYVTGIPIFLSILLVILKKPKSVVIWCLIPFMIVHSIIPHKEERFLFPMIFLIPFILASGFTILHNEIVTKRFAMILLNSFIAVFISVNLFGLLVMSQKSAGVGRMEISKYIHDRYKDAPINLICMPWANPYNTWSSIPVKFYLEKDLKETKINNLCELSDTLIADNRIDLLVIRKGNLSNIKCRESIVSNKFMLEKQSMPKWIQWINKYYNGFDNKQIIMLYRQE